MEKIDIDDLSIQILNELKPHFHEHIDFQTMSESGNVEFQYTTFGLKMWDKITQILNKNIKE